MTILLPLTNLANPATLLKGQRLSLPSLTGWRYDWNCDRLLISPAAPLEYDEADEATHPGQQGIEVLWGDAAEAALTRNEPLRHGDIPICLNVADKATARVLDLALTRVMAPEVEAEIAFASLHHDEGWFMGVLLTDGRRVQIEITVEPQSSLAKVAPGNVALARKVMAEGLFGKEAPRG